MKNIFHIKYNLCVFFSFRSNESDVNLTRTIEHSNTSRMPEKETLTYFCDNRHQQTELIKSNLPLNLFNLKRNELNQDNANRVN